MSGYRRYPYRYGVYSREYAVASEYAGWWARTFTFGIAALAGVLAGCWPLLVFRSHWTTTAVVKCTPGSWAASGSLSCVFDKATGTWLGSYTVPAVHSGVSALGMGLTAGWVFLVVALVCWCGFGRRGGA